MNSFSPAVAKFGLPAWRKTPRGLRKPGLLAATPRAPENSGNHLFLSFSIHFCPILSNSIHCPFIFHSMLLHSPRLNMSV